MMTDEILIKNLIKQGESNQLEFKEFPHKESVAKAICGFLNAEGGIVLIGVMDDKKVVGLKDSDKVIDELKRYLLSSIIPEAPITFSLESIDNREIVSVKVWNGSKAPYVYNNNIYVRVGSQTKQATPNHISKLIVERQKTELHWERQLCIGITFEDLDEYEIRNTIRDLNKLGRGKIFEEKQTIEFLSYYGLYQNGNFTNAAVVLFAKEPARYLPQCRVRLSVINNKKTSNNYSYDRILEGNLFRDIEEIIQFFEVNIAVRSQFRNDKWKRKDFSFPKLALREGIMNALIHRDYSNISGSVLIVFYSNRLEITNYGELPRELKPSDLAKNHLSLPRNPDIAHVCFIRGWIEKIGRGTVKIIEDCEEKGFPKPIWNSKSGITSLTFPEVTLTASRREDVIKEVINEMVDRQSDAALIVGITTRFYPSVILNLKKIVRLIYDSNNGVSIEDCMKKTKKSKTSIYKYLEILRIYGLIVFEKGTINTRYFLTKNAKKEIEEASY